MRSRIEIDAVGAGQHNDSAQRRVLRVSVRGLQPVTVSLSPESGSSPRVAGYSDLGLILCRFWIEAQRGLVFVIELFSHRSHLSTFELGDFDSTPTLGSADERAEHQLQNSSLTKGVGNDLEAAALLDEQALKQ